MYRRNSFPIGRQRLSIVHARRDEPKPELRSADSEIMAGEYPLFAAITDGAAAGAAVVAHRQLRLY